MSNDHLNEIVRLVEEMAQPGWVGCKDIGERGITMQKIYNQSKALAARVAELEAQHTLLRIEINKLDADLQFEQRRYQNLLTAMGPFVTKGES